MAQAAAQLEASESSEFGWPNQMSRPTALSGCHCLLWRWCLGDLVAIAVGAGCARKDFLGHRALVVGAWRVCAPVFPSLQGFSTRYLRGFRVSRSSDFQRSFGPFGNSAFSGSSVFDGLSSSDSSV